MGSESLHAGLVERTFVVATACFGSVLVAHQPPPRQRQLEVDHSFNINISRFQTVKNLHPLFSIS